MTISVLAMCIFCFPRYLVWLCLSLPPFFLIIFPGPSARRWNRPEAPILGEILVLCVFLAGEEMKRKPETRHNNSCCFSPNFFVSLKNPNTAKQNTDAKILSSCFVFNASREKNPINLFFFPLRFLLPLYGRSLFRTRLIFRHTQNYQRTCILSRLLINTFSIVGKEKNKWHSCLFFFLDSSSSLWNILNFFFFLIFCAGGMDIFSNTSPYMICVCCVYI